jgi:hypothetical protein
MMADKLLEFDADDYPLAVDSRVGATISVTHTIQLTNPSSLMTLSSASSSMTSVPWLSHLTGANIMSLPCGHITYRLQSKLHPYLHAILRYLIIDDQLHHALMVTTCCLARIPFFLCYNGWSCS